VEEILEERELDEAEREQRKPGTPRGPADLNEMKTLIRDCREWQADLLFELYRNKWSPRSEEHVHSVAARLDRSVADRKKARFAKAMIDRLNFEKRSDREADISKAYQATFEWIYTALQHHTPDKSWDNFKTWLEEKCLGNIYWITGKPGSGKSTLMKFLWQDPRTHHSIGKWAGEARMLKASFFFWNSGTAMQMSRDGLLRSLLYQVLVQERTLAAVILEQRWELYDAGCGGFQPWTWGELKRAFDRLVSQESFRLFLLIDGLDEFESENKELTPKELKEIVTMVIEAGGHEHVRLCVSSRPWNVFEDAFRSRPNLRMENLTHKDIKHYVSDKFNKDEHYQRLHNRDPGYAETLIEKISDKSLGVFLWVYLVVASLLDGFSNSGRLVDLENRLNQLPVELEDLFDKLLNSLDSFYYEHACQLIVLVEEMVQSKRGCTLLLLGFADAEPTAALRMPILPLGNQDRAEREADMQRRLNSRCKCLLESNIRGEVIYIHRTARDFVRTPKTWSKIRNGVGHLFDHHFCLSISYLQDTKVCRVESMEQDAVWKWLWESAMACIHHLSQSKSVDDAFLVRFLDELDYTVMVLANEVRKQQNRPLLGGQGTLGDRGQHWLNVFHSKHVDFMKIRSFLEFSVWSCTSLPLKASPKTLRPFNMSILQPYACCKAMALSPLDEETASRLLEWKPKADVKRAILMAVRGQDPGNASGLKGDWSGADDNEETAPARGCRATTFDIAPEDANLQHPGDGDASHGMLQRFLAVFDKLPRKIRRR